MTADASLSRTRGIPPAGRELDERIAIDVMGISREDWRFRCFVERHDRDEWWCYDCLGLIGDAPLDVRIPARYSTDIADAWTVVEKMRADGWDYWIGNMAANTNARVPQGCAFFMDGIGLFEAESSNTSEAICLAALAAVAIPRTDDGGRET